MAQTLKQYQPSETIRKDLGGNWRCEFCGLGHGSRAAALKHVYETHSDRLKQ